MRRWEERGGGLVANSMAATTMDVGVTANGEMEVEQRDPGEKMDDCVKAVLFDLDDTLVPTHAVDKTAQQAALVSSYT